MLEQEGQFLVKTARNTFITFLTKLERLPLPQVALGELWERRGVFVRVGRSQEMLWTGGMEILCCLGYPFPSRELIRATVDSTIACAVRVAASRAFKTGQLDNLLFEVSVLTKPELLNVRMTTEYAKRIERGKDGLLVQYGFATGLVLPQVSIENNYDEKDSLSECCVKAGLAPDSWLTFPDIGIYKFQDEIFRETGTEGAVVRFDSDISEPRETS
jgi:uncharacterized protein (TIGR00296 family)